MLLAFKPAIAFDTVAARCRRRCRAAPAPRQERDGRQGNPGARAVGRSGARSDGRPAGIYRATLHVPRLQARGDAELEVVACDTAGNVSRRPLVVAVAPASPASWAGGMLLLIAAFGGLFARRKRAA